ncbi:protein HEG [Stigmatopora nigra]
MKTWSRDPFLGLFLLFTLTPSWWPFGAGTPIKSRTDAGTTAFDSYLNNTGYELTSTSGPKSESSAPSSLFAHTDTEQTQSLRETSTKSLEAIRRSTEIFTSSLDSTSSESGVSSKDWKDASQTQNLSDITRGVSNKPIFSPIMTQDSSHHSLEDVVPFRSQTQTLTDSKFTATTINRAGERTLLSVTSSSSKNNSSPSIFTEHSSAHQSPSTWSTESTGETQTEDYTHSALSTEETKNLSLTQSSFPDISIGTQNHIGIRLNATEHQYMLTSETTLLSSPSMSSTDRALDDSFSSTYSVISPERSRNSASYEESTVKPFTESSSTTVGYSALNIILSTESSSRSEEGQITSTQAARLTSKTNQYDTHMKSTEVFITTTSVTETESPEITEEDKSTSTMSTSSSLQLATSSSKLSSTSINSTPESPTQAIISSTSSITSTPTLARQSSAAPIAPFSNTDQSLSSPVGPVKPSDVTISMQETSTSTIVITTPTQIRHTTAPYILHNLTKSSGSPSTTRKQVTDMVTTERIMATTPTHVLATKATSTKADPCISNPCMNGGTCTSYEHYQFTCGCQQAWTGPICNQDMDECENDPCPVGSRCVNTKGSFSCECPLGFDLEDGRTCTRAKTFLGTFSVNRVPHDPSLFKSATIHEIQRDIIQLLNATLSHIKGYSRSTVSKKEQQDGVHLLAVNMFSSSSDVTSAEVSNSVQMSLKNCSSSHSHCHVLLHHRLTYHVESLCVAQGIYCNPERSTCTDVNGIAQCQCLPGYYKHNLHDLSCLECGDGYKLENGTCVPCTFGFGGFNCGNFYKLIAVVVSPAGGALLLILIIALIVTCCKKDKNDLNKIIFKSGDMQMSPYTDFPKSNRISMEWGRETIEMQENGSTKNLLQMTDIYYSPALRNSDLDRNGLYPFTGLPGSRHSCIYPAQWNPSFISDDSRRRDYF